MSGYRELKWYAAENDGRKKNADRVGGVLMAIERAETTMTWAWIASQATGDGTLANSGQCSEIGRIERMKFACSKNMPSVISDPFVDPFVTPLMIGKILK